MKAGDLVSLKHDEWSSMYAEPNRFTSLGWVGVGTVRLDEPCLVLEVREQHTHKINYEWIRILTPTGTGWTLNTHWYLESERKGGIFEVIG